MKRTDLILLIITLTTLVSSMVLNRMNIEIRLEEMKIFIQKGNRTDNNIDHVSLLINYKTHKDLYEERINDAESAIIELKIKNALSSSKFDQPEFKTRYPLLSYPVIHIINFIRFLLDLPPITLDPEQDSSYLLESAYLHERNKRYSRANEIYSKILAEGNVHGNMRASILIHQGYCLSIMGDYKKAREKYINVIKQYGDSKIAITAALLLRYIDGFRREIDRIMSHETDSVEKGKKLYRLIAYRESLEVMKHIEESAGEKEAENIAFFKARALEELGRKNEAVKNYQKIIEMNSRSKLALSANRRIYIMGESDTSGKPYIDLASENNKKIRDKEFSSITEKYSKLKKLGSKDSSTEKNGDKKTSDQSTDSKETEAVNRILRDLRSQNVRNTEKRITEKKPELMKIYISDGNIFTGYIVKENKNTIKIKTSIGFVIINKKDITKRETMR